MYCGNYKRGELGFSNAPERMMKINKILEDVYKSHTAQSSIYTGRFTTISIPNPFDVGAPDSRSGDKRVTCRT